MFNVCQTWIAFERYIPSNGFLVLFPHGQGFVAITSYSLLLCIMYEMILWAGTQTQGEKYKKAISFIAHYIAVRNNLELLQIVHFGKFLDFPENDW